MRIVRHAVTQLVEALCHRPKVTGSIPDVVDPLIYPILPAALWPGGLLSL
jgi:hypothetical protein